MIIRVVLAILHAWLVMSHLIWFPMIIMWRELCWKCVETSCKMCLWRNGRNFLLPTKTMSSSSFTTQFTHRAKDWEREYIHRRKEGFLMILSLPSLFFLPSIVFLSSVRTLTLWRNRRFIQPYHELQRQCRHHRISLLWPQQHLITQRKECWASDRILSSSYSGWE